MSHNYPYRRPPSDTDLRPKAGSYSSADRRHISPDADFYRPSQEPFASSYPPSSSSRGSSSQDNALSILSSCGLEPSDLALLAELPEDVLTVESLPHVLKQIKGKRGTSRPFSTSTMSPSFSSTSTSYRRPPASSSGDWNQPVQYPLGHVASSPPLSEQGQMSSSRTSSSIRADPTPPSSSSASRYAVDFHHRSGPSDYGKTFRSTGPSSPLDRPSFSSAGQGRRTRPAGFSESRSADYMSAPPPEDCHPKPRGSRRESHTSSSRSSSRHAAATAMPSEKAALDFHGTCPTVFPYSCSLCDITVLSEKVWTKHINGTQHAEGQLSLLQLFPDWDCRLETVSRANSQSEKRKDEEKTPRLSQTASQTHKPQPNIRPEKKTSEKGKVVCVKFPAQSVDEVYLRKLTGPFGKIVKILMFPSLAFVELGSVDQARELVKFHVNYPPTVNGEKIEFSISNTFSFLQSSQVVSFTPVPLGEDGQSDLISIVRRFGPPLYTLFLPSAAFVEMKNTPDAQKMVDYYSSNTLRINNEWIKVSFSGEYKTLMRVSSAKRYEEEMASSKRTRSSSKEKGEKTKSKRMRSSSKDREQEKKRSRSRDKSTERSSRGTRSKSREKSKESKASSRSRDESSSRSSRQNSSREKSVESEKPESSTEDDPAPLEEAAKTQQAEEKAALSAEESDIEGMEVIGEDGENVVEEDMEGHDDAEDEEDAEEDALQAERSDSPEEDNEEEEKDVYETKKPEEEPEANEEAEEAAETPVEDDEQEPDFPVDLENCITLDELEEEDQSDDQGEDVGDEAKSPSTRVVYFKDLPLTFYTDAEFIKLVKDFGKAVRYLLIRNRQEGFIEMSSSSEAQRVAKELSRKPVTLSGSKLSVNISNKYIKLTNGWEVQSGSDTEEKSQSRGSSRRSERRSKSTTSDPDETCRKSEGKKESSKKTPEKEPGPKKSAEKSPEKESFNKKTEVKDVKNTVQAESHARKSKEKDSDTVTRTSPGGELAGENASEESVSKKPPLEEFEDKKTQDEDLPVSVKAGENSSAEAPAAEKSPELLSETSEEKKLKSKGTPENKSVSYKQESDSEKTRTEEEMMDTEKSENAEDEETPETGEGEKEPAVTSSHQPDPPEPQTEQQTDDRLQESEDSVQVEERPGEDPAEPEKPTKPVGAEFVRPVVGYFCNLCQLIYADEDEAKLQHCSTLEHYRKYQEKTGEDPWSS